MPVISTGCKGKGLTYLLHNQSTTLIFSAMEQRKPIEADHPRSESATEKPSLRTFKFILSHR